jgi:hypothetical protein
MNQILVPRTIPGKSQAASIMSSLSKAGIHDIQMFYDPTIIPSGMWAVVQVVGVSSDILLPKKYNAQKPYILWWCKDEDGKFRYPNDHDLDSIIQVVRRAPKIWAEGEDRANKFEALDAEKDRKHNQKFKDKIHEIAPDMKRAIREGNL